MASTDRRCLMTTPTDTAASTTNERATTKEVIRSRSGVAIAVRALVGVCASCSTDDVSDTRNHQLPP